MSKKRESFPLKDNKDPLTGDNSTVPPNQSDLERAKEKLKPGVKSTFSKKFARMKRALGKKDEPSEFRLLEEYPFDLPWSVK